MDFITVPFGWVMMQLYQLTQNYGVALILFGILVKVVLLPVTAKSKKSTMKMSRMQPRIKAIQAKYANDQQKQAQELQALYKEEGVSMLGGCLWGFVPLLILIPLYSVVREPLVYMLGFSEEHATGILNALAPLDPATFSATNYYAQMAAAQQLPAYMQNQAFLDAIKTAGIEISEFAAQGVNFSFLGFDLGAEPSITGFTFTWSYIGVLLMPLLSAASQMLSMLISTKMNNSVVTNDRGVYDKETAESSQTNKTSKTMMWIMPLMSLWIGFNMPAAMSLYWLIQGVVSGVMDYFLTRHYRKIYDAEDAIKLQAAMEKEKEEAEKERIRAERRAANPDGITENTSKKKLQQAKKAEEEAAKAAAAKEYAMRKGLEVGEEVAKQTNVPGSRPYSRGRAYDPNRYNSSSKEE